MLSIQEGCIMLFTYYYFFVLLERKRSVELCKRENNILKLVYRINNTRYSFTKNKLPFKLVKPHFVGRIVSN